MTKPRFTIVTATAGAGRWAECTDSWYAHRAMDRWGTVVVAQGARPFLAPIEPTRETQFVVVFMPDYLGPVPAFKLGVDLALQITAPDGIIACLHDDLLIEEPNWDAKVLSFFNMHPEVGLVGFGGGTGLGSDDIYKAPYNPMQLARQDFVSNMREAEAHGRRATTPTRVACLDGFSQIGRVDYWQGCKWANHEPDGPFLSGGYSKPLTVLESNGVIHHAYDAYLGALAVARGWQVYMLPIACHHYGGQTAVGDAGYQEWAARQCREGKHPARTNTPLVESSFVDGDARFWQNSHRTVYDLLRGLLPIRV